MQSIVVMCANLRVVNNIVNLKQISANRLEYELNSMLWVTEVIFS